MNQQGARQWSYRGWLAAQPASPRVLRLRRLLAWALVSAFWLDWAATVVALSLGREVRELNPLGHAIYANYGPFGLAGLKAWASFTVLTLSEWVRPHRAVKVLAVVLALYATIILWNVIQLLLFV